MTGNNHFDEVFVPNFSLELIKSASKGTEKQITTNWAASLAYLNSDRRYYNRTQLLNLTSLGNHLWP